MLVLVFSLVLIIAGLCEIRDALVNGFEARTALAKGTALGLALYLTSDALHVATVAVPTAGIVGLIKTCDEINARAIDEEIADDEVSLQRDNTALGKCADKFNRIKKPFEEVTM